MSKTPLLLFLYLIFFVVFIGRSLRSLGLKHEELPLFELVTPFEVLTEEGKEKSKHIWVIEQKGISNSSYIIDEHKIIETEHKGKNVCL